MIHRVGSQGNTDFSSRRQSHRSQRDNSDNMELPIKNPSNCSVRSVIQFLVAQKVPVPEIHRQLVSVYGEGIMSIEMVRKWKRQFESGRENVHDEERSGRPSVSRGEDAVLAIR